MLVSFHSTDLQASFAEEASQSNVHECGITNTTEDDLALRIEPSSYKDGFRQIFTDQFAVGIERLLMVLFTNSKGWNRCDE